MEVQNLKDSLRVRAHLLSMLVDEDVVKILKDRYSAEQRADLVSEIINPHRPLKTAQKAALAGIAAVSMRARSKTSRA